MPANTESKNRAAHPKSNTVDRRAAERHRCLCECLVRVEEAPLTADWPAMVYNISTDGVGLALPFPALAGSVLVIERRAARRGEMPCRARVIRTRLEGYVWFHGCAFLEPLGTNDLQVWLEEVQAPVPE
jgi:hypothetical protein